MLNIIILKFDVLDHKRFNRFIASYEICLIFKSIYDSVILLFD